MLDEATGEPVILNSTKQIKEKADIVMQQLSGQDAPPRLWNFKDILSWKIPDTLLSSAARQSQERLERNQNEIGYICSYVHNTHLFQYDLVT